MLKSLISFSLLTVAFVSFAQTDLSWDDEKIEIKKGIEQNTILSASAIIAEGWGELAQPIFWKKIMELSPDSCLINIASSRVIVAKMSKADWNKQSNFPPKRKL